MSELAWKLALLFGLAGLGAILGAYCLAALFRRRDPVLYGRELPAVSAATVEMLRSRDRDMPTCAIDLKLASPHQPLYAAAYVDRPAPLAIEAAPVSRSRT